MDKRGFYAVVVDAVEYVTIHYFDGKIFTEQINNLEWYKYDPFYKTPSLFNKNNELAKMEYLGE